MKTTHTPGPRTIGTTMRNEPGNGLTHEATPIYGESIAVAECKAWVQEERETVAANARLIAAAPEMLEALLAINAALTQPVQFSGTDTRGTCNILRGDCQVAGSIARAAIAKATA